MFPRGPRFAPQQVSDVPGPNTYNLPQESQLEAYKRGAFLEKTDRFNKQAASDVPGPGAYNTDAAPKSTGAPVKSAVPSDKYATLQRKVDDLERLHHDEKKSHHAEVERLKLELARAQKTIAEQAERLEKQRKHADALDARAQELKKTAAADAAEAKDLRAKLRMAEHERAQLAGKQGDAGELKKAAQAAEARRREEVRERDRKIAELEKAAATERKRVEAAEARLKEVKAREEEEVQGARVSIQNLKAEVASARDESEYAQSSLTALQRQSACREDELVAQLEQYRAMLGRVAEEYGRLASSSVPLATHSRVKNEHTVLQMRVIRLERKLANVEGQVVELAHLIRHTKDHDILLAERLKEAEAECAYYANVLHENRATAENTSVHQALLADFTEIIQESRDSEAQIQSTCLQNEEFSRELYRLRGEDLLLRYSIVDKALVDEETLTKRISSELDALRTELEALVLQLDATRAARDTAQDHLHIVSVSAEETKATAAALEQRLAELEADAAQSAEALRKERAIVQRLNTAVHKSRAVEEAFRAEVEQLTTELADAERYQEAYYSLSDEVGALLARKALAEEEAQRLSQFNAEILGHHNPAQRIMYVDRIRRELAETKHKLLLSTREHEAVVADTEELRHELDMYKSVMVPEESKPRTNITRITRPPLANLNQSLNASKSTLSQSSGNSVGKAVHVQTLETIPGDMTLDEIL